MDGNQIHFELFVRRHPRAPWELTLASEDRAAVIEAAQAAAASPGAAVRVFKETCDPASGAFRPLVLLERGAAPARRPWRAPRLSTASAHAVERPACVRPEDLYAPPARGVIATVLEAWLRRHALTSFELLHRADLAERLEASATELSAAIYEVAAAQAAAKDAEIEPIRATLTTLTRAAIDRLIRAAAGGDEGPSLSVGMAIAERLKSAYGWGAKVETLLDLIAGAARSGPAAELARRRLQQPLAEALGGDGDLADILGVDGLGDQMLILVQVAAPPAACAAARRDAALRRALPPLKGLAARLAAELQASALLTRTRRAVAGRALRILASPMRLWPDAPQSELDGVQAAFALLRASGRLVDMAEVDAAEAARWRLLASPGFVDQRLALNCGALEDADVLLDLVGAARGREALDDLGQRLAGVVGGETFMSETRFGPDSAKLRRAVLTMLRKRVAGGALGPQTKVEIDVLLLRLFHLIDADGVAFGGGPILVSHRSG